MLKKSNGVMKKKIQTMEESLSQARKTNESFLVDMESSKKLTMLLKFHQHPYSLTQGILY